MPGARPGRPTRPLRLRKSPRLPMCRGQYQKFTMPERPKACDQNTQQRLLLGDLLPRGHRDEPPAQHVEQGMRSGSSYRRAMALWRAGSAAAVPTSVAGERKKSHLKRKKPTELGTLPFVRNGQRICDAGGETTIWRSAPPHANQVTTAMILRSQPEPTSPTVDRQHFSANR